MPIIIILLAIIALVVAWPLIATVLGALFWIIAASWQVIAITIPIAAIYILFLSRIAKKNNIKLGGKMGERLDPSKPIGPSSPVSTPKPTPSGPRSAALSSYGLYEPEKREQRFDER